MITVALPNYASEIAWLAMEGLCNQITNKAWELIIYEDSNIILGGKDFYLSYKERLEKAGCISIKYVYSKDRIPLNYKWVKMTELAHKDSYGIILQASDAYSEPLRLATADYILSRGYDWLKSRQGVLYNTLTCKLMEYKNDGINGFNMAISKRAISSMPKKEERWASVDHWLVTNLPADAKIFTDESENWRKGVGTDGYNRLSLQRREHYNNPKPPFYKTDIKIESILSKEIIERL